MRHSAVVVGEAERPTDAGRAGTTFRPTQSTNLVPGSRPPSHPPSSLDVISDRLPVGLTTIAILVVPKAQVVRFVPG